MSKEGGDERSAREEKENQKAMREGLLRILLTSEARERLTNIGMVKPGLVKTIEDNIISLASAGRLKPPVTDEDVKKLLLSTQKPKREFKIRWV